MNVDDILKKRGLKYDDLSPEEQETLNTWISTLDRGQINIPIVREYISKMKDGVSSALTELDETPDNWLTILCFFIPFVGIIRKWYLDQKKFVLIARLRNYILLDAFLSSPERARRSLEKALDNIRPSK